MNLDEAIEQLIKLKEILGGKTEVHVHSWEKPCMTDLVDPLFIVDSYEDGSPAFVILNGDSES